jgi:hypothetical protein
MTFQQIDRAIETLEHKRDAATGKERRDLDNRILNLLRDRMDMSRAIAERDLDRGEREHAAWYDTSAELN